MKDLRILVLSLVLAAVLTACSTADENFTGSEYMPDMAHSVAMEANTYNYYYYNTWDDRSTVKLGELAYPHLPVEGTVPRGYASEYLVPGYPASLAPAESMRGSVVDGDYPNAMAIPTNGHVPYYYEDTPEGREEALAANDINPFPITADGLARGENLYNIFCAICHGETGNGLGVIYDTEKNPQAKYPLAPANFLRDEFIEASNQRYYYPIMYGYNAMGAYADKMNYEERWQVIHHIRALQAKDKGLEYSELANTLNAGFGQPSGVAEPIAERDTDDEEAPGAAEQLSAAGGGITEPTLRKK